MTTIVYRDGVLAADSRAYSGDSVPIGHKKKIGAVKQSDGSIVTFGISTPHPGFSEEIRAWLGNERDRDFQPQEREFNMLLIEGNGEVFFFHNSFTPSGPIEAPYYAVGSGAEYALGALAHGATAVEAVEAASELDAWTKGPIHFIDLAAQEQAEN